MSWIARLRAQSSTDYIDVHPQYTLPAENEFQGSRTEKYLK